MPEVTYFGTGQKRAGKLPLGYDGAVVDLSTTTIHVEPPMTLTI
jgi:hypothetical protein